MPDPGPKNQNRSKQCGYREIVFSAITHRSAIIICIQIRQKPTIGYASMTFTKLLINLDLVMSSSFRFSVPQAGQ